MIYPDLSKYKDHHFKKMIRSKCRVPRKFDFVNVGWIDTLSEYQQSAADSLFLERLRKITSYCRGNFTRGLHFCSKCGDTDIIIVDEKTNLKSRLGSCEIFVIGKENVFVCPDLIYHYVSEHNYSPPEYFKEAVLEMRDLDKIREMNFMK